MRGQFISIQDAAAKIILLDYCFDQDSSLFESLFFFSFLHRIQEKASHGLPLSYFSFLIDRQKADSHLWSYRMTGSVFLLLYF